MSPRTEPPATVDSALRTALVVWFAMLATQVVFVVFIRLTPVETPIRANGAVVWAMLFGALAFVAVSYPVKTHLLRQAVAKQSLQGVMSSRIIALALCEVAGILGVLSHFLFDSPYYGLFFAVAGLGMMGHYPRRAEFEVAAPPKPIV